MNFSSEFQRTVEKFTKYRIDVSLHYLLNLNYIDKLYPIGKELFNFTELKDKFSNLNDIDDLGVLKRIKGPYGRIHKNTTIYRMKFNQDLVIRYYDSFPLSEFNVCKEKIIYPFLDGTLNKDSAELRTHIKNIISRVKGNYIFDLNKQPIVPVPNLIYFDESKTLFPCNYTIQEYIPGKPFFYYKNRIQIENLDLEIPKLTQFFKNIGKLLAKIHDIRFDHFVEDVCNIGTKSNGKSWYEIINAELEHILTEAKKNKINIIKDVKDYIKDNQSLIDDEIEPVAVHNNFQGQNLIIKDEPTKIQINGVLNFENWRVGVRAMDFASFDYMSLRMFRISELKHAFFSGYEKYYKKPIDEDFLKKIEIYKLFFFLKEFNKNPINSSFKRDINKILVEN